MACHTLCLSFGPGLVLLVPGLPRAGSAGRRGRRGRVVRCRLPRGASSWGLASGAVVSLRSWSCQGIGFAQVWPFSTKSRACSGVGWVGVVGGASGGLGVDSRGRHIFFPPCLASLWPGVGFACPSWKMTSRTSPWWGVVGWGGGEVGGFRGLRAASCQAQEVVPIFPAKFSPPRTYPYPSFGPATKSLSLAAE